MLKFHKTISLLVIITFAATTTAWSGPKFCLRQRAALERNHGFEIVGDREVCLGVHLVKLKFRKEGRFAEGWVFVIQPWAVDMNVEVYADAFGYNFYNNAITKALAERISAETGRTINHKKAPGKRIEELIEKLPPDEKQRLITAGPAMQSTWTPNGLAIAGGRLITRTAPGVNQTPEQFDRLKGIGGAIKLNGLFNVFVINSKTGRTGNRWINFEEGVPKEDVSDILLAVSGPPMLVQGNDVSSRIKGHKGLCPMSAFELNWDPAAIVTSFAGLGKDIDGNIIYAAFVGDMLCSDLVGLQPLFNLVDLMLGPGSIDINIYVRGEETNLLCKPSRHSDTASEYPEGRPLGAIFYVLEKEFPRWEDVVNYLLEQEIALQGI